jgi:phenylalanyl-tRNA synthetase beta chain
MLAANGFAEIMCNSLNPAAWFEQNDDFDKEHLVVLANPLSSDLNAMRQSLLYGGLSSVAWNINRQNPDLKLFEFGHCYFYKKPGDTHPTPEHYQEKEYLDLYLTGHPVKQGWNSKTNPTDFFHIKSRVEMVLSRLGVKADSLVTKESEKRYFSESLSWIHNNKVIAEAGKISKKYLKQFDIDQEVYYGNIEWDLLVKLAKNLSISFHELPKYPWVRRDLALLLDSNVKFSQVRETALKTERNILQDISLFDVYESDSLGANKKSYAVSFTLRDDMKTLTDKSIEKVMNNLIRAFEKEFNAQIR